MRWEMGRRSDNVEDRRGMGLPIVGGGIGTVVVLLLALFFGFDPSSILPTGPSAPPTSQTPTPQTPTPSASPGRDEVRDFVAVVLADTEDTWREIFRDLGKEYRDPKLVLFTGAVQSACGSASAAVGPFYCPADHKLYLDLGFFRALRDRLGAPGDFAQAYVIAHEVGHHVQNLLGLGQLREGRQGTGGNSVSVRRELQADCFAGVWAHHAEQARKILEAGDLEEAVRAAAAVGDDRLQRQSQGTVVPDSFTHGSSAQRVRWLRRGFDRGDVAQCDTFRAAEL
jgi:predicted metalloprotease